MTFKTQEKIFCQKQVPLEGGTSFPVLTFAAWEDLPGIRHCFTTRAGGVSEGYLSSLNFRRGLYDPDENINENFRRTARFFDVAPDRIVCAQQTHTANVRIVTALAHSGWKGTVARIGQVTIRKMTDIYGCRPEDIYAAIGPSICADCYEVSEDVADAIRTCFNSHTIPRILARGQRPGKYQLDLWRACERILLESGIRQDHLTVTNLCTCENSESLFSHRATNGKRGNQGAFLMMV